MVGSLSLICSVFSECENTFCSQPPVHSDQEDVISYGKSFCLKVECLEAINQFDERLLKNLRATLF